MSTASPRDTDEWPAIEALLPKGWQEQARRTGAFQRARYLKTPAALLRVLLLHALGGSLKQTTAEARAASIASMSHVALYLRLKTSTEWLRWIACGLCDALRQRTASFGRLRPRAVDSTTIESPGSTSTEWRLHYALDLFSLNCDWYELTDAKGAESLARTPVQPGDVMLADRNYLHADAVRAVVAAGGHVLVRMRWRHASMVDSTGKAVKVLSLVHAARVSRPADVAVRLVGDDVEPLPARIVILKLPLPIAERNRKKLRRRASKKQTKLDPNSLKAAGYVFLFTTLPAADLDTLAVAELYRLRWQIEIAFKRHKQLLKLGRLPNKDPPAAASWILAKLIMALLLETLYRNAAAISPWGFEHARIARRT